MTKRILPAIAVLVLCGTLRAQYGNTFTTPYHSDPTGAACTFNQRANYNGNDYYCASGVFAKGSGGGAAPAGVTGSYQSYLTSTTLSGTTDPLNCNAKGGADFGATLALCVAALPAGGGTADMRSVTSTTSSTSLVLGSDTQRIVLLLPNHTVTLASSQNVEFFTQDAIIGEGDNSNIVCQGAVNCVTYGGSGTPVFPFFQNFHIGDSTSGSVGLNLTGVENAVVQNVVSQCDTSLLLGANSYYNHLYSFEATATAYAAKFASGANRNSCSDCTLSSSAGVALYDAGDTNNFPGIDIESSSYAEQIYGAHHMDSDGYYESNTNGIVIEYGARGNIWWGGTGLVEISDLSGNDSNFYFQADGVMPWSQGANQQFIFGVGMDSCGTAPYGTNCEVQYAKMIVQGQVGVIEDWLGGFMGKGGQFGHAPRITGYLQNYGGTKLNGAVSVSALGTPSAPSLTCPSSGTGTTYTYYVVAHDYNGGVTLPSTAATITCPNAPSSTYPVYILPPQGQVTAVSVDAGNTGTASVGAQFVIKKTSETVAAGAIIQVTSISGSSPSLVTGVEIISPGEGYVSEGPWTTYAISGTGNNQLTVDFTAAPFYDGVGGWDILKGTTATSIYTSQRCGSVNPICADTGQSTTAYTTPTRDSTGDAKIAGTLTQQGGSAVPITVATGTITLATSSITSGACQAVTAGSVNSAAAAGVVTTDVIEMSFSGSPVGIVGFEPTTNGMLTLIPYPTAGYVNVAACNNTGSSISPGSGATLNWRVTR